MNKSFCKTLKNMVAICDQMTTADVYEVHRLAKATNMHLETARRTCHDMSKMGIVRTNLKLVKRADKFVSISKAMRDLLQLI